VVRDIMADPPCIDADGGGPQQPVCTPFRDVQFANPRVSFLSQSVAAGSGATDVARTVTCLAEGTGNIYPLGQAQTAPDIFWGGFEAPGLATRTCGPLIDW
jgi:hypothetical protein